MRFQYLPFLRLQLDLLINILWMFASFHCNGATQFFTITIYFVNRQNRNKIDTEQNQINHAFLTLELCLYQRNIKYANIPRRIPSDTMAHWTHSRCLSTRRATYDWWFATNFSPILSGGVLALKPHNDCQYQMYSASHSIHTWFPSRTIVEFFFSNEQIRCFFRSVYSFIVETSLQWLHVTTRKIAVSFSFPK